MPCQQRTDRIGYDEVTRSLSLIRKPGPVVSSETNQVNAPMSTIPHRSTTACYCGLLAATVLVGLTIAAPAKTVGQELTAEMVRTGIDRGTQYLFSKQQGNGSWRSSTDNRFPEGVTTLCTLALLNAGVPADDPRIRTALQQIIQLPEDQLTTYVASLRIMALTTADPDGRFYRPEIQKDVEWLISYQIDSGPLTGGWSYPGAGRRIADASNTQFALLALHEAKRIGARIPKQVWERATQYWERSFDRRRGGFSYVPGGNTQVGSMTCAGISSLIIAEENLAEVGNLVQNGRVACCQPNLRSEMIERALDWLARRFAVRENPNQGTRSGSKFYYLYGLERVGRLSGRRFIGAHDWYREGTEHLLKIQKINGSWVGRGYSENEEAIATSFALLFLSKGKRPIAMGKFKFGVADDWDRHPQGVHYLTRELENQWQTKLNWQTIDGNNADVRDLAETPVLFISGRDQLDLTAAQKKALKDYVENGNFIFAEASQGNGCGTDVPFDRKFRSLMAELFPDTDLQPLSASHPIWNAHFPIVPDSEWPVYGLQACCRTSVVYVPRSLTGHWQLNRPVVIEELPKRAAADVKFATELGVNVVSYATGRQLRDKLDMPDIASDAVSVLNNRSLVLPKLSHRGGADDAPNAWRNVLRRANEIGLSVDLDRKIIEANPQQLVDHPFVFLHGRSRLRLKPSERDALSMFLEGGNRGFVFADAICSSEEFRKDFAFEIGKILPGQELQPIPPNHPIWTDQFGGFNIDTVTITKPDRSQPGGYQKKSVPPQFEGVEIDGRLVVVFSPYDLSCALENATVSQCEGYTRQDAIRLAMNVLLYRLQSD